MMLIKLGNLWNFNQINSWVSHFIRKTQNMTYSIFIAQCGFSKVCNRRICKEGRFTKYNTTRWAIELLQLEKGLRAGSSLQTANPWFNNYHQWNVCKNNNGPSTKMIAHNVHILNTFVADKLTLDISTIDACHLKALKMVPHTFLC